MARRKTRKSSAKFLSIPFLLGALFILLIAGVLTTKVLNQNSDVKSASDSRLKLTNSNDDTTKAARLKTCFKNSRVVSFSLSGSCENKERDGFTSASYTCQNGTSGNIGSTECIEAAHAFAKARLACAKTACPTVTPSPRPSISPKPVTNR